jgi:hypothetical protein
MRAGFLAALGAIALAASGPVAAAPDAEPQSNARKVRCKGAQKNLGSRIKRAPACDAAGNPTSAADERLPISLQIKAPQAEPGQRARPQ